MRIFRALEASGSALTAERLRLEIVANNIANLNTTRTPEGGPYRRQMPVYQPREAAAPVPPFAAALLHAGGMNGQAWAGYAGPAGPWPFGAGLFEAGAGRGVRVVAIAQDQSPPKLQYDPTHPDADADGYVALPNVDLVTEMVDLISATRAYEANVTAINAAKAMASRALDIGRS